MRTTKKTTAKKTAKARGNAAKTRAATRAYQNHLDREVYKAYCAGYARQMQQTGNTADVLMLDPSTATTAEFVAFAMGIEHGGRNGGLLPTLRDVIAAVTSMMEQK